MKQKTKTSSQRDKLLATNTSRVAKKNEMASHGVIPGPIESVNYCKNPKESTGWCSKAKSSNPNW